MSDSTNQSPQINVFLLKDDSTDTSAIEAGLATLGYSIIGSALATGEGQITADAPPDVILVASQSLDPVFETAVAAIQSAYAPRPIAVVALLGQQKSNYADCYDAVLIQPAHPVQIHNRIAALTRLRRIETALILRRETLTADFGVNCEQPDTLLGTPFRILFVGSATPEFIAILNVLQEKNVELFAAFTSFMAFDYLYDKAFDAVVLNATESIEPALSISEALRETPQFYDVPTLVMADNHQTGIGEAAIQKGARDIFFRGASQYEISGRILELANFYRIHSALKKELAAVDSLACLDRETSLYDRDFLHSHIARVAAHYSKIGETVSLLMLRVRPVSMDYVEDACISSAINELGRKLKSLVRAEDIAVRVSEDIFAIAFPGQARSTVEIVGERIKSIIDNTAFGSGLSGRNPLTLEVEFLLSEKMAHEDADRFINRTESELMGVPSGFLVAN